MPRSLEQLLGTCFLALAATISIVPVTEASSQAKPTRYRVDVPDSSIDIGAAKVSVRASAPAVEKAVLEFNAYSEMISKFKRSKVVGKSSAHTDVYLQVPILNGAAKVWAVVRFSAPTREGGTTVVKGRMLQGNVDVLDAEWRIRPVSEDRTELHLRMRMVPKFPAPGGLVTDEVAYAADQAVRGIRTAVERR